MPPAPRSRTLDIVAACLLGYALLHGGDLILRGLLEEDPWGRWAAFAPVRALRFADPPLLIPWLVGVALAVGERVFSRVRLGALDRWLLERRLARLNAAGDARGAARIHEQLGRREIAAEYLLAEGHPRAAAEMFAAAALPEGRARALVAAGDVRQALAIYRGCEALEPALRLAVGDDSQESAAFLESCGQLEEAVQVHLRGGRDFVAADLLEGDGQWQRAVEMLERRYERGEWSAYARHLACPPGEARRRLMHRIAWLYAYHGYPERGAAFHEELEEWDLALALHRRSGDPAGQARCLLRTVPDAGELTAPQRKRLLDAADCLAELQEPRAVELLLRGGRVEEASELAEELGDPLRAAELARQAGQSVRAGELYAQAERFGLAAAQYEAAGLEEEARELLRREAQALEGRGEIVPAARLFLRLDARDEARRVLQQLDPGAPDAYEGRVLQAELLRELGLHERAVELLDDLAADVVYTSEQVPTQLALADSLERLGRCAEAARVLERLADTEFEPSQLPQDLARLRAAARASEAAAAPAATVISSDGLGLPASAQDLVGRCLERYELVELLGEGSFAWVYRARHTTLGRAAAVKVLKPALSNPSIGARFLREGRALATFEHPHLIRVYEGGTVGALSYLALELVSGPTLSEWLEARESIDLRPAVRIALGLLDGLAYAHDRQVVHRDLKPANLLLAPELTVKVVDFGLAHVADDAGMTRSQDFLGTPRYASPEQGRGDSVGPAADQYAAALIVYELLTGRLPFESQTSIGYITQHVNEAPAPLRSLASHLPAELEAGLLRALAKQPAQRFPGVRDLREVLVRTLPEAAGAPPG